MDKNKLKVNIIGCPIERDQDGLALSSRNSRLNEELRAEVPVIFKTLSEVQKMFGNKSIEELGDHVNNTFLSTKLLIWIILKLQMRDTVFCKKYK